MMVESRIGLRCRQQLTESLGAQSDKAGVFMVYGHPRARSRSFFSGCT
jgi:hypothetical protein